MIGLMNPRKQTQNHLLLVYPCSSHTCNPITAPPEPSGGPTATSISDNHLRNPEDSIVIRRQLEAIFRVELEKKRNRKEAVKTDLMDGLMQIKDDEGDKLSDKEVIDNIVSLVIGGYTTTALSAMWAIYYLAKYPNVLQKLREENMIISQNKNGDFITRSEYKGYIIPKNWNMLATTCTLLTSLSVGYKWKLLNPDADMMYLPHPRPVDNVEIAFSKI
ncbi:hypothetical protein M0R45_023178 [Rubus argutus]|uniref:Cytochrome P450 n=1 Tax=Rubus argutus TaxID=59490 RepID=A0AAW1WQK5_RUBAR